MQRLTLYIKDSLPGGIRIPLTAFTKCFLIQTNNGLKGFDGWHRYMHQTSLSICWLSFAIKQSFK